LSFSELRDSLIDPKSLKYRLKKFQKICKSAGFWIKSGISKPVGIQAQADFSRICVALNVDEVKPAFISYQPNIHTIVGGRDTDNVHIHAVPTDAMSFIFPSIKDTIITISTPESKSALQPGGSWDDMGWDDMPELPKAFFDVFIRYLVSFICFEEDQKFLMEGFPPEYLSAEMKMSFSL